MSYTGLRKQYLNEWRIWYRMCYRCEKNMDYYIETQVCADWQGTHGFAAWLDHIGPRPSTDHVMDRINKLGNYEPGNVEWVTKETSANNQRRHSTQERCRHAKIARANGIKKATYYMRIQRGWAYEDASTLVPSHVPYKKRLI